MTTCYVDAFSGLAGDMLLGALVDAGADRDIITHQLNSLDLGAEITWDRVMRRGIAATKFQVKVTEPQRHRRLSRILDMVQEVPNAGKIFRLLGEAEATVHGVEIERVHFHEVGAVDSICDIVGIALALELLHVERICCSAINVGSGTVKTEHGVLPVPAPATALLLKDKPIYARGPAVELTTPTGAAVIAALADSFGTMPALTVKAVGYGAGDKDFAEHANVVRVMIGEASGATESTNVCVIEANIDDASPQVIAYTMERLLSAGALDALVIPAQMKKGRPGVILQVLAPPEKREFLAAIVFRETTTLGIRFHEAERRVLPREWDAVETKYGVVRIKLSPNGFMPEYEDAKRIASDAGVPLKEVLAEAASNYLKR